MRKLLILFVLVLLPWLSVQSQKPIYQDAGQPVEIRVKDLLKRMTLHEKVLQLNQYTLFTRITIVSSFYYDYKSYTCMRKVLF